MRMLLLALCLWPASAVAQIYTVTFTPGTPADRHEVCVDTLPCVAATPPTATVGPLAQGVHQLTVKSFNGTAVTTSSQFTLTVGLSQPGGDPAVTGTCFVDGIPRVLPQAFYVPALTPAKCIQKAKENGFAFAGVENHGECYGGNSLPASAPRPAAECAGSCPGDTTLNICSGIWGWRINVFPVP